MAEEDVTRGVAQEGDGGDGEGADEWVAPGVVEHPQKRGPQPKPGPNDEVTPQSLDAHLEETVVDLPLSDVDEDPSEPVFLIDPNAYGPGTPSIRLANGTPVGVWLRDEHPDLDGPAVRELLLEMGLAAEYADWYGKHRGLRIAADSEIAQNPAVQAFAEAELRHDEQTAEMRKAFIEAQKRKEKK